MTLSIIVAMTDEGVIGVNNRLPWHLSEDLKRFKKITMGHTVIMGRKTFESIGKPLPGRQNIVVTANRSFKADGAIVVHSLQEALGVCGDEGGEKFIIGGASLFEAGLPMAQKIYLTLIHHPFEGDVLFPRFDVERDLKVIEKREEKSSPPHNFSYSFITGELTKK